MNLSSPAAHALAELFPRLQGADLTAMADDIEANGLHHAIILYGDPPRVLDGRNRLAACSIANIEPRFETFEGTEDEALALVLSLNLARRHLSTAQKATLAVRLLPIEREAARRRMHAGRPPSDLEPPQDVAEVSASAEMPINGEANALAGARVGLSKETVRKAARIAQDAPTIFAAMEAGVVRSLGEATKLAALDAERRAVVLARMRAEGIRLKDADEVEMTPVWYRSTGQTEWYTPAALLDAGR